MPHDSRAQHGVLSLDLISDKEPSIDVTGFFVFSEVEAIRQDQPELDTLSQQRIQEINICPKYNLYVDKFIDFHTLDIAQRDLSRTRGLSRYDGDDFDRYTVNICPPLKAPLGAIDVRGEPLMRKKVYSDLFRRSLPASLHVRRFLKNTRATLREYRRPIIAVIIFTIGLGIPSLVYVRSLVEGAFAELSTLNRYSTPTEVIRVVHEARAGLERANILFLPYKFIPEERIRLARIAIDGGLSLTRGIDTIMSGIEAGATGSLIINTETSNNLFRPVAKDIRPLEFLGITEPTTWMTENHASILYLRNEMKRAGEIFQGAAGLSHPKASEIAHIGRGIEKFVSVLDFGLENQEGLLMLLGNTTPERYIIFNQNRDEIRANGGFPGTIVTFTMFKGNITDYRTDDVYYYDWNLYPFKELPPPGLALITGTYGLRDVNYYPDFKETLEKANAFIERSGDPTVTIGLSLHQGIIEDILSDIGPVTLSGVSVKFTKENFSELMSTLVESRYGEKTSAKDILAEFVPAFMAQIHEKRAYEEVLTRMGDAFRDGEILFASRNTRIDTFLSNFKKPLPWQKQGDTLVLTETGGVLGASGKTLYEKIYGFLTKKSETPLRQVIRIKMPTSNNWAYPLLTSLSGNKSDRFIERTYTSDTTELNSCQVQNKLTFTHKHTFKSENEKEILSYLDMIGMGDSNFRNKILTIEGKGKNIGFVRLLVPITTTLTGSTAGINMTATPEYREFSFTLETPIGGATSKSINYISQVPGCKDAESVLWYRQPGLQKTTFISR